tara:strand:- start:10863 stop:13451 length:2589 start_codon:yes stop_codon:yes gene_type:complete
MRLSALAILFLLSSVLLSCASRKNMPDKSVLEAVLNTEEITLTEAIILPDTNSYRAAETRVNDILHMDLNVSFDWKERSVIGSIQLDVKPYFYATTELILDAKGMEISEVSLVDNNDFVPLEYTYDNEFLSVQLDKEYTRSEVYRLRINYTAFPEKVGAKGSSAISSAQGIYFINPDSTEVNKLTQIWTQGETESNSVWFPTIDSPNERLTQELKITVQEKHKTLSNGALIFSNYNGDGTRTDYWKQELPHAPYLVMMAIGDYSVVTDSWENANNEDIVVDYYLEAEYALYARDIFGNTPEMLTFYSEVLGFPYPWDKYSQVIVRDFVSGAMENTSAVIHGDFLNATDRELLDGDNEAIIAHELFHHWFGDLVTCESWSNLPLNESFATYGEYLWEEHKYGRYAADLHGMNSMAGYLAESQTKQEDLIRFYYDDKEDMFDGHSYNKGGRVLHMLRYFLGDDAFFSGLKLYLEDNQFESVEIHQLRLAMEEISGKDLNWFFNQWFLGSGHPELTINYDVNDSLNTLTILVEQTQEGLFRLPLEVDIYTDSGVKRQRIDIRQRRQEFILFYDGTLSFANLDAEKVLLGTKKDNRPDAWWPLAYHNAKVYLDKSEALDYCLKSSDPECIACLEDALSDSFWKVRKTALKGAEKLKGVSPLELKERLLNMVQKDPKSLVRARAIKTLSKAYNDEDFSEIYTEALNDPSYAVIAQALKSLVNENTPLGLAKAKELENEKSQKIKGSIAKIYAKHGDVSMNEFMVETLKGASGFGKFGLTGTYTKYLKNQNSAFIAQNLRELEKIAVTPGTWWVRLAGYNGLKSLQQELDSRSPEDLKASAISGSIKETIITLLETEDNEQIKSIITP